MKNKEDDGDDVYVQHMGEKNRTFGPKRPCRNGKGDTKLCHNFYLKQAKQKSRAKAELNKYSIRVSHKMPTTETEAIYIDTNTYTDEKKYSNTKRMYLI